MTAINKEKESLLDAAYVRELLDYDSITGIVTRKNGMCTNYPLGTRSKERLYIYIDGRVYSLARVIWLWYYGKWPDGVVDHKNQNKNDNKLENLREATYAQNCQNRTSVKFNGGVSFKKEGRCDLKKPWLARITVNKKRISLGSFTTKAEAIKAYSEACLKYHGEFAQLGVK